MINHIFDLHLHPVFKTLFKDPGDQISPWDKITVNGLGPLRSALDSQASLGQIASNPGMNLICMPIYAPETAFSAQWILFFASYFLSNQFSHRHVVAMGNNTIDYADLRAEEREQLLRAPAANGPYARNKVKLLTRWSEYDPGDLKTIHVLLCVEGGHNFYGPGNNGDDYNTMLNSFRELLDSGICILYVTPAHLAPNTWLNHAFATKIFPSAKFRPIGDGVSQPCYELFTISQDRNVIIDVKHMSLKSRRLFYKHHHDNYFNDRPIFASHVGFTGISRDDIPKYYRTSIAYRFPNYKVYKVRYNRPKGHINNTWFNPCSVNMYDEDLIEVINSGGLIGLSMDVHIMGADIDEGGNNPTDFEYITNGEYPEFNLPQPGQAHTVNIDGPKEIIDNIELIDDEDREKQASELANTLELTGEVNDMLHLRHYINHILHLCKLKANPALRGRDPLKQICIGSDFDGLIQGLHCCPNVEKLPVFAVDLANHLSDCAAEAGIILPMDPNEIVERLFYRNAHEFLETHFSKIENGEYRKQIKR